MFAPAPWVRIRAITRKAFVACLRNKKIAPHIAMIKGAYAGAGPRTTRHASYAVSQKKRKRVEEIFGWMKTYGGLRKTMMRGIERVQLHAWLVGPRITCCGSLDCSR